MAEKLCPALFCDDPGAEGPGWVMTDMAGMPAIKVGYPIAKFVLVKSNDGSLHR